MRYVLGGLCAILLILTIPLSLLMLMQVPYAGQGAYMSVATVASLLFALSVMIAFAIFGLIRMASAASDAYLALDTALIFLGSGMAVLGSLGLLMMDALGHRHFTVTDAEYWPPLIAMSYAPFACVIVVYLIIRCSVNRKSA